MLNFENGKLSDSLPLDIRISIFYLCKKNMQAKNEFKNAQLSFFHERSKSMVEFSSPVGEYFKGFPIDHYDLMNISSRPEELTSLIEELDKYFKLYKPLFLFESGFSAYPYEIYIDRERLPQLKNGCIPIILMFLEPYFPPNIGYFSWEI